MKGSINAHISLSISWSLQHTSSLNIDGELVLRHSGIPKFMAAKV